MARSVEQPPNEFGSTEGVRAGGWWHETNDGEMLVCDLCPRGCSMKPNARGFCFVRQNLDGRQIVSTTYGQSTGFCIDPIEKKPLNHFFPGTSILSFGTAGCNLGCKFCQNWSISKSREVRQHSEMAQPASIARAAKHHGCQSVAFTYNDPIVWAEYAIDTAQACHELGVQTVAVTSGYMNPAACHDFYKVIDAANVDLKAFSEDFYRRLTAGHLEPVLQTLQYLAHQTDVWFEITNLVIPETNDSPDELKRMCDWIVEALHTDVPVHFSAFHPDFKFRDLPRTPPETLAAAHDIARAAGIRYAYTGNIHDRSRQSTYCPGCNGLLIERDGYDLGVYSLRGNCCAKCSTEVAGRFSERPGNWGARRLPIRITDFAPSQPPLAERNTTMNPPQSNKPDKRATSEPPQLTKEQEALVFQAAGQRVTSAVTGKPAKPLEQVLADTANLPVLGSFVTLKRGGQLRSCCGFLGQQVPLHQALDHAAVRAAREDPRFPPISPTELEYLDVEVWLLWGLERVIAQGEDRVGVVEIGRHGLQIARGTARGLLLPGVAVEHQLDARSFLEHVCRKAGLPNDAWLDEKSVLSTFEGSAIEGSLRSTVASENIRHTPAGPTPTEMSMLGEFCRSNLLALFQGATPNFYLPSGYDGQVSGIAISVRLADGSPFMETGQLTLRPELPLQSSLFELVKAAASGLRAHRIAPDLLESLQVGLAVFWDPAMHGTVSEPILEGIDPSERALTVLNAGRWAVVFDTEQTPEQLFEAAIERGRFAKAPQAAVCSMATASTETRITVTNIPLPMSGPLVRPPAVAGRFYPATVEEIDRQLDEFLSIKQPARKPWAGALVPHAGWIYSGQLAAEVLGQIKFPEQIIVVCPKHGRDGSDWAVTPHESWSLPGGSVAGDPELAQKLAEGVDGLELDAMAHRVEHAIEVQLPLLGRLAPNRRVVGVAIHGGDLARLRHAADQLADVLGELPERPLMIISTDMNHYADENATRRLDRLALDALETLDAERLFETVSKNRISMCGVLPTVWIMETLKRLDSLNRFDEVGYATSAAVSGDTARVVGYAGLLFA